MINYHKYLPVSREDEDWGLCVVNAGCNRIPGKGSYPPKGHPAHHAFNWKNGRVLDEYQIIYITKGQGVFESDSCKEMVIREGTIVLLFPGERHRYKPDPEGWDEYWIGIKGQIADHLLQHHFFTAAHPCIYIGFNESIFELFNSIIEKSKTEPVGYQPLISGAALHLLGCLYAVVKQDSIEHDEKQVIINRARMLFRTNISKDFSPEQAAAELNVGYSWFRKVFKSHTGLSPGQYYIQLKIERARELLRDPSLAIKQIAYDLNFDSYFYFSKLFKEKTGLTPTDHRKRALGKEMSPDE